MFKPHILENFNKLRQANYRGICYISQNCHANIYQISKCNHNFEITLRLI